MLQRMDAFFIVQYIYVFDNTHTTYKIQSLWKVVCECQSKKKNVLQVDSVITTGNSTVITNYLLLNYINFSLVLLSIKFCRQMAHLLRTDDLLKKFSINL